MLFATVSLLGAVLFSPAQAQSSLTVTVLQDPQTVDVVAPVPTAPLTVSDNDYPLASLAETEEGSVTLNLIVDAGGRVTFSQTLTSSGHQLLDQAASQAARRWLFKPAQRDGQASVGSLKVQIDWKLPLRPADDLNMEMTGGAIAGRTVIPPSIIREAYRVTSRDYPNASVRAREQGEVVLKVLVQEDGTVGDARVLSTSRFPRLDERAVELATDSFKYRPGSVDGRTATLSLIVSIPFVLAPVRSNVALRFCRTTPITEQTLYAINPQQEESDEDRAQQAAIVALQYHVTADGSVNDVIIPTKRGWMHFNETLTQNFSRVARYRPAREANRPESCWFDGRTLVTAIVPNSAESLLRSGEANRDLTDYDRAIDDFTRAIAISPQSATAYFGRAGAYKAKGDIESALRDYSQAISIEPNSIGAFVNRGNIYQERGQFAEALKDYDQAIKINPRNPTVLNNRCFVRAASNDPRGAIQDCNRAINLNPRYANAFVSRAFARFRVGDYRTAIADYDAALKLNAKLSSALYGRGAAKIRSGDEGGGRPDIEQAIALDAMIAADMAKRGVTP
jgi:TonB family protein